MSATGRREHFEHIADIGIRGIGASPAEAFAQAALALAALCGAVLTPLRAEDDLPQRCGSCMPA